MFRSVLLVVAAAILWAEGVLADETPNNSSTGCGTEYLLIEFRTKASVSNVTASFNNVPIVYCFKVYGIGHYFVVVENDESADLRELTLPEDAVATAFSTPVGAFSTLLAQLGFSPIGPLLPDLSKVEVTLVEWTWRAEGLSEDQFNAALTEQLNQTLQTNATNVVGFVAVGHLPMKLTLFWEATDCSSARFILSHVDPLGGPGGVDVRVLRVHTVC